nr:antirestriction protein [Bradyrhizobium sp. DOA9]
MPWVQPWGRGAAKAPLALPKSAATGRQYNGINILILWGAAIERAFTGQSWLTFRQALSLGGHVRKGELGTIVAYAGRFVPADERRRASENGEEAQAVPFPKRFNVLRRQAHSYTPLHADVREPDRKFVDVSGEIRRSLRRNSLQRGLDRADLLRA